MCFSPFDCKYKQPILIEKTFLKLFSLCEEKNSYSEIPNYMKCPDSKGLHAINRNRTSLPLPFSKRNFHAHPTINLKYMLLMWNNVFIFGPEILIKKINTSPKV